MQRVLRTSPRPARAGSTALTRAAWLLLPLWLAFPAAAPHAVKRLVPSPDSEARAFGTQVFALPNGNLVVTDPDWALDGVVSGVGAVYLLRPDGRTISRITGARAGDRVGSGGMVLLSDGNFVLRSPTWQAGSAATEAGAVTWGSADLGFSDPRVSKENSLVGEFAFDRVGHDAVLPLPDGAYVVASSEWRRPGVGNDVGAVTRCAAGGRTVGVPSATNSLVGSRANDRTGGRTLGGHPGVVLLASGDYVVLTNRWRRGTLADAGAVTWASRDGSTVGSVGEANSLVGSSSGDFIGIQVQALANGHYIVQSPYFDHAGIGNVGAVTWVDGSGPHAGEVLAGNSLIGSQEFDVVGLLAGALGNGHYVVSSPLWDAGATRDVGAVTWRDGNGPSPGVVGPSNSLVGSRTGDAVGYFENINLPPLGVVPLAQHDYVVASPSWDNGSIPDTGAATWQDGSMGGGGVVSAQNSLVGANPLDAIAQFIQPLANGNYVVASPLWSQRRGAATLGQAGGSTIGAVGADNSLVGSTPEDLVSGSGVYPLANDDYAVATSFWSLPERSRLGAVTRGSGTLGITGEVSAQNSVVGVEALDRVASGGVVALPDGDFLVRSALADGLGAITRIGAPPAFDDRTVSMSNSLVGKSEEDRIGAPGPRLLSDGNLVVHTANAALDRGGAITLMDAEAPFKGTLVEDDTARSGAVTGGARLTWVYLPAQRQLVVGDPAANQLILVTPGGVFGDGFEAAD